jgi:hypothetical protein
MNITMIFVRGRKADAPLTEVAAEVFRALGVSEWEERESSNYPPDGHYFAGYCENAEVTVFDDDSKRTPDYPFAVSVEDSTWRKGPGVIVRDVEGVAKALSASGFTVFVPVGPWAQVDWDGDGDVYAASP